MRKFALGIWFGAFLINSSAAVEKLILNDPWGIINIVFASLSFVMLTVWWEDKDESN